MKLEQSGAVAVSWAQPPAEQRRKKVAVLGFTPSWKLAPFADDAWEIWALNELYVFDPPRVTRWFDIHTPEVIKADTHRDASHWDNLAKVGCIVYMQQHYDDIPNSVPYPLDAIRQEFGSYLNNTISYMVALAIMEGAEEIGIYGVDMAHDCLAPDMRVLTADLRWVPASSLKVGDGLLAFDEEPPVKRGTGIAEFRKYRKTTVESLSNIRRPCYRLHMADGTNLVVSEGHQWLTMSENTRHWQRTASLQPHEVYAQHPSKIVKLLEVWQELQSWDAGYLAAAFDGEGHISQGKRNNCQSSHMSVGFSQKLNGMSEEVERALVAAGMKYGHWGTPSETLSYQIAGGRSEILRFLGSVRPRRLMQKFDPDQVGTLNAIDNVIVEIKEFIGEQDVIGLRTGTGTLIVEGYASHNSEYQSQRPSCEYFVGVAVGRGVKVWIPDEADLMKCNFLYGFEEEKATAFDAKLLARRDELRGRLDQAIVVHDNQRVQLERIRGALQDNEQVAVAFKDNRANGHQDADFEALMAAGRTQLDEQLKGALQNHDVLRVQIEQYRGALQDCEHIHKIWQTAH